MHQFIRGLRHRGVSVERFRLVIMAGRYTVHSQSIVWIAPYLSNTRQLGGSCPSCSR